MRILKTKLFARYARKNNITDDMLGTTIANAERGLVDADLGGGLVKQRIARPGSGKSGGYRTIVLYRKAGRAVFVYGFAKSERENMTQAEERVYKDLAAVILAMTEEQIDALVRQGEYVEVETAP